MVLQGQLVQVIQVDQCFLMFPAGHYHHENLVNLDCPESLVRLWVLMVPLGLVVQAILAVQTGQYLLSVQVDLVVLSNRYHQTCLGDLLVLHFLLVHLDPADLKDPMNQADQSDQQNRDLLCFLENQLGQHHRSVQGCLLVLKVLLVLQVLYLPESRMVLDLHLRPKYQDLPFVPIVRLNLLVL